MAFLGNYCHFRGPTLLEQQLETLCGIIHRAKNHPCPKVLAVKDRQKVEGKYNPHFTGGIEYCRLDPYLTNTDLSPGLCRLDAEPHKGSRLSLGEAMEVVLPTALPCS